jgi:hypothetical protein
MVNASTRRPAASTTRAWRQISRLIPAHHRVLFTLTIARFIAYRPSSTLASRLASGSLARPRGSAWWALCYGLHLGEHRLTLRTGDQPATDHDRVDLLGVADVVEWVRLQQDQIGELAHAHGAKRIE